MSCLENDKYYEAAYEDFNDLYFVSGSFASLVNTLIPEYCDVWTDHDVSLRVVFDVLWQNDCELLCRDRRTAVEALIMYKDSMRVFRDEK